MSARPARTSPSDTGTTGGRLGVPRLGDGSQMQSVAINWHVYLLTRSPLALGFVGLSG